VEGERALLLPLLLLLEVEFFWIRDEVTSNEGKPLTDWLLDCWLKSASMMELVRLHMDDL
jgi:hypothetical protein